MPAAAVQLFALFLFEIGYHYFGSIPVRLHYSILNQSCSTEILLPKLKKHNFLQDWIEESRSRPSLVAVLSSGLRYFFAAVDCVFVVKLLALGSVFENLLAGIVIGLFCWLLLEREMRILCISLNSLCY